ncbi:MAG: gamma-glutamylcyclotransferase [Pseudomonadota bacterium]|nr:gamma-glutamylcyclotransferase [Pseudomonadota bacterium]
MSQQDSITYVNFAYGSNMCSRRLRERTPSARALGVGRLPGHKLAWHMAGADGSAKCDIVETGRAEDAVWGVLYEIAATEKHLLDQAEGLGRSYHCKDVEVVSGDGSVKAETYCALTVDPERVPYDWYHAYVLEGALEHGLPSEYADALKALEVLVDPDDERRHRHLALTRRA